jgi:hypothetical protein
MKNKTVKRQYLSIIVKVQVVYIFDFYYIAAKEKDENL